jgi:hypothetical protein
MDQPRVLGAHLPLLGPAHRAHSSAKKKRTENKKVVATWTRPNPASLRGPVLPGPARPPLNLLQRATLKKEKASPSEPDAHTTFRRGSPPTPAIIRTTTTTHREPALASSSATTPQAPISRARVGMFTGSEGRRPPLKTHSPRHGELPTTQTSCSGQLRPRCYALLAAGTSTYATTLQI